MIDEKLIVDLRQYIFDKTGKHYFGRIKTTPKDIMVSCPFHKEGQERKPSCGISRESTEKSSIGTVHCFSCGVTSDILSMLKTILEDKYDESEIDDRFQLSTIQTQSFFEPVKRDLFKLPSKKTVKEDVLREYRNKYPTYLKERGITEEVAEIYDIGFDEYNKQITFPIRNIYKECIGVGRRNILFKRYAYPSGMVKPVYGVYELPRFIRYLWVVEGPFNLWSLRVWNKTGVALLGTGTGTQHNQLLTIDCEGYVLALDPDEAGIKGTFKLGEFLLKNGKTNINVILLPLGKDINDLTQEEFKALQVVSYKEWKYLNRLYN